MEAEEVPTKEAGDHWVVPWSPMLSNYRIISWNCRSAKNLAFHRSVKEMLRSFKPDVFIILEPRISGTEADAVCNKLGKTDCVRSEATGFSSGVWISLEVKIVHRHFICTVINNSMGWGWDLTTLSHEKKYVEAVKFDTSWESMASHWGL